jgi:DNA polymerase-3 subunit gamma/tau
MFENIIGQTGTIATISSELAGGTFPRAVLFYGPPYSGKLSTALETARVLTCRVGAGEWTCDCPSCRSQKELNHSYTVFLGHRYSEIEIASSADAFLRSPRVSTRFLFLRAVRKLVKRFDPTVWDAEETRMKNALEKASRIEELLLSIPEGEALSGGDEGLGRSLEGIIEACVDLAAVVKNDHITIGQIRKLSSWARLTTPGSLKVALVENAERMQESARNAMLKLLEEPPEGIRLILLSTRRSAILPTVLSRLRPYGFPQRSGDEEREVLAKIFRDESGRYQSLRSFFLAWKEINSEELSRYCRRFVDLVSGPADPPTDILKELAEMFPGSIQRDREPALSFLEELTLFMRGALRQSSLDVDSAEEWLRAVREAQVRIDLLNMNPQTVIESLFLKLSAARRGLRT